jgi:hypothetical protein
MGLLLAGGGVWLAVDTAAITVTANRVREAGRDVLSEHVTDSFEQFYSVFNKAGGWNNLAFVMVGIGVLIVVVSIFGFCGVHQESVCLLLTYIVLLAVAVVLQTAAALLLARRDEEMAAVSSLLPPPSPWPGAPLHPWLAASLSLSAALSALTLLLAGSLVVGARRTGEGSKHLLPL